MKQEQIDRINALYRKSQAEGLTEAEKEEQAMLRKAYVADVKRNLVAQLNNIDMQNPDGTVTNLGEEYGNKKSSPDKKRSGKSILPSEMQCQNRKRQKRAEPSAKNC